ncbi:MAG: FHA domain-containing protein [Polyangiaceae bacterium]|nr:FHA domain-containing protein [Polyangiaceae bacterium]
MWKLVIEDDEGKRTVVPLTREDYSIGRQEGNTIRLTERNVSREHGFIRRNRADNNGSAKAGSFAVEDRSSYNGIFVNGLRVAHSQDLQHGDLIQIGDYRIVLQDEAAVPDTAATPEPSFDAKTTLPVAVPARGHSLAERPRRFVMLVGPTPGVEYPLDRDRITIGREQGSTIYINHNSVSRLHCEVHALSDGRFEIVDNDSANGVGVNGVSLRRGIIEAGDVIELGDVRFKFVGAGQVFVPGPHESQQLDSISERGERKTEIVEPKRRSRVSPTIGVIAVVAVVLVALVAWKRRNHGPDETEKVTTTEPAPPSDPEHALLLEAKKACSVDDCEIPHSQITTQLAPTSPLRDSMDFKLIEATWADSILKAAQAEPNPVERRALLVRVANAPTVDEARRKLANEKIAEIDKPTRTPNPSPGPGAARTLTSPSALPAASARPVVTPPAQKATALEKARAAALGERYGEVRSLLEKHVRAGHGTPEEARLLRGACQAQRDTACVADIEKKY